MLKSQDIIIHIYVIDGALSEYEVGIVTSSFVDDVTIHCQHCFDHKCIGEVYKSKDIIIPIKVIHGPLSESEVSFMTSSFVDDVITHCQLYFYP